MGGCSAQDESTKKSFGQRLMAVEKETFNERDGIEFAAFDCIDHGEIDPHGMSS